MKNHLNVAPILLFAALWLPSKAWAWAPARVVFVHGANFSAGCWRQVQEDLAEMGIDSLAPSLYTASEKPSLSEVARRLCGQIRNLDQTVVLVGHSQGGAIITEAAGQCPSWVDKLVYVAAVLPKPGESVFGELSQADNDHYAECGSLSPGTGTYLVTDFAACRRVFMGDLPVSAARRFFEAMVPEPASIGDSNADYSADALDTIPKFYLRTRKDRIISLQTQNKIIEKTRFKKVFLLDSSHTPFFSRPRRVSSIIAEILTQ